MGKLVWDDEGATVIEYCILAALIAGGIAGGIGVLADNTELVFDAISTGVNDAGD